MAALADGHQKVGHQKGVLTPAAAVQVRGLVFINPGNPTGQCLTKQNLQELIQFCADEHLVLMADEVGPVYHAHLMSITMPWPPHKVYALTSPDHTKSSRPHTFVHNVLAAWTLPALPCKAPDGPPEQISELPLCPRGAPLQQASPRGTC